MNQVVVANVTYANISVGVSITTTSDTAHSVSFNKLAASVSYVIPAALVNWVSITMYADTDPIGFNRFIQEYQLSFDSAAIGVGKRFFDTSATSDSTTYVLFKKGLVEAKVTSEVRTISLSKSFSDTVHPTDDFYGVANLDDDETMVFGKSLSEAKTMSDVRVNQVGKRATDTAATSEVRRYALSKAKADATTTADTRTSSVSKSLADSLHAGDEFNASALTDDGEVMVFGKSTLDSVSQSDSANVETGKTASDAVASSDTLLPFELGKGITDNPVTAELYAADMAKPLADSFSKSDANSILVGRGVAERVLYGDGPNQYDTYAVSYFASDYAREGFPALSFTKSLTESVNSTDDFHSHANGDDDETMQFTKTLNDLSLSADALTRASGKALADSFSKSDATTLTSGKSLSDSVSKSDTKSIETGKSLADTFAKSDIVVSSTGKAASDSATTSESKTFNLSKSLLDSVHPTDDFNSHASGDDEETMLFTKSVTDSFTKSDSTVKTAGKGLTDSVSKSDSGSLVWTDYWDINYTVTTSGVYVGNSQTF